VVTTGITVAPTRAHLAQGTEGTTVQIMIGAGVILGMIAVMEQCMIGEAQYMIVTTGAEALLMIAMIGGEVLVMINTSWLVLKNPVRKLCHGGSGRQHDFSVPSILGAALVSKIAQQCNVVL